MVEPFTRLLGSRENHAVKLQRHLYDQMMSQSEFCDVTLLLGDTSLKAHWCVLVSCPYFQSLYDSGMAEKKKGEIRISVGKPAALRTAIRFLYSGEVEITSDTMKDILEVADYLQIIDLKAQCAVYISCLSVTLENCVSLCLLTSLYDLDSYFRVFDFVRGHLPEVMEQEETLNLSPESVTGFLTDESLNYVNQEDFFKFIVKWVEHDVENRKEHFTAMFCELDLQKVTKEFLEKTVETQELVRSSDGCKVHVLNTKMKYMTGILTEDSGMRDTILVLGGNGPGQFMPCFPVSANNIYCYIIQEDRWTELAPLPYPMRKPAVAFDEVSHSLFVYENLTRSTIEGQDMMYMFKYSVVQKSWNSMRVVLPDSAGGFSLTIHNILMCSGRLYVVASGKFSQDCSSQVEWQVCLLRLSEDEGHCELLHKLFPRSVKTQIQSCVVADTYISILGGKCGSRGAGKHHSLTRFVYYDTTTSKKYSASKNAVYEPLMFAIGKDLFVTRPGLHRLRKFSFQERRWFATKELLVPLVKEEPARSDYTFITYRNDFYMFGGKSATTKKTIDSACRLNVKDKKWEKIHSLPQSLANAGVCVASLPAEHVRCHIDCPHCIYFSLRTQASYHIDISEEEEDDEDNSYDFDGYNSDIWDEDDFFDPFDQYDWY